MKKTLGGLLLQHIQDDKNKALESSYDLAFGKVLSSDVRKVLWETKLTNEQYAKDFFRFDHQTKRVKFDEEMRK